MERRLERHGKGDEELDTNHQGTDLTQYALMIATEIFSIFTQSSSSASQEMSGIKVQTEEFLYVIFIQQGTRECDLHQKFHIHAFIYLSMLVLDAIDKKF